MRFIQVQYADIVRKRPYTRLEAMLTEFVRMNTKAVEVSWQGTYKNSNSAFTSLSRGINMYDIPAKCAIREGRVYLIRTDI